MGGVRVGDLPIQHSWRAQGLVFTKSGGSTPMLRHRQRATLHVFICQRGGQREGERGGDAIELKSMLHTIE